MVILCVDVAGDSVLLCLYVRVCGLRENKFQKKKEIFPLAFFYHVVAEGCVRGEVDLRYGFIIITL